MNQRLATIILLAVIPGSVGAGNDHAGATRFARQSTAINAQARRVRTLAGSGEIGYRDGTLSSAQFMMPVGLAFDRQGRLYVADQAAQRIRMVSGGRVSTIAGSGSSVSLGLHVAGGYLDGPALRARFHEPSGVAVTSDGTIYVADELNHSVRRLQNGIVTTYAGSPNRPGALDGDVSTAEFSLPTAIAADDNDNLYVADYGVGIREISKDGSVTTLSASWPTRTYFGVTVSGGGDTLFLFAVNDAGGYAVYRAGQAVEFGHDVEEGGSPHPYAVAAVNDQQILATDVAEHVIRLYRLREPPYVIRDSGHVVAGTAFENGDRGAGYVDGDVHLARFYAPLGIAVHGQEVAIADSGNRRLRAMPLPDLTRPVSGDIAQFTPDPSRYRIILVGPSYAFYGTDWDDSIPGKVQRQLLLDQARFGLSRSPRVSVVRLDAVPLGEPMNGYLKSVLVDRSADLVIICTSTLLYPLPALVGGTDSTALSFQDLRGFLEHIGAQLFVFVMPDVWGASPVDSIVARQEYDPLSFDLETTEGKQQLIATSLKSSGVWSYFARDDVDRFELSASRRPLWSYAEIHTNEDGLTFIADEIVRQLELKKPWNSVRP